MSLVELVELGGCSVRFTTSSDTTQPKTDKFTVTGRFLFVGCVRNFSGGFSLGAKAGASEPKRTRRAVGQPAHPSGTERP